MADLALDVELGGGLGEGEIRGPEPHLRRGGEHPPREAGERRLEVHEADSLVHRQAFELEERRRVGRVPGVVAVHHPRDDHAIGRRPRLHHPDLHRRGMGAEQDAVLALAGQVEGVVQVHRRMVGREIEGAEVVPLGLRLGAHRDGEAELAEDGDHLVEHTGDRMERADPAAPARHGEVPLGAARRPGRRRELRLPRGERRLEGLLELVGEGPEALALVRRQSGQGLERGGERPLLPAQHGDALGLQRGDGEAGHRGEAGQQRVELGIAGGSHRGEA